MQGSIAIDQSPSVQYLLRIGDTCLILGQRIAEWCGHAPILEEDIAMSIMALDLIGQARAVLTHAGQLEGRGHDEDQLAYLRDEKDYRNLTLVESRRRSQSSFIKVATMALRRTCLLYTSPSPRDS